MDRVYEGVLEDRSGVKRARQFPRLNDAILWLMQEFEAGEDGNAVLGEIRLQGALVWRRSAFRTPRKP
jgi:hypothetical protein